MTKEIPSSIGRVQRDLEIVQQAIGNGYPFDRLTIAAWLGMAAVSALAVVTTAAPSDTLRVITLAGGVALLIAVMILTLKIRQARARAPFAWREIKTVSLAKLCAGPPLLAFVIWQFTQGAPSHYVVSTTAFWAGLIAMIYASTRPWRRVGFGLALPLLVLGGIVPVIEPHRIAFAAACAGIVAGVSCASIIAIQMKSHVPRTPR